jgi:DNA-binding transcriptional regulator YiaG
MTRKPYLRELMKGAGLTYQATADLLHVSKPTVKAWLQPPRQEPPEMALELLAIKTGQAYVAP